MFIQRRVFKHKQRRLGPLVRWTVTQTYPETEHNTASGLAVGRSRAWDAADAWIDSLPRPSRAEQIDYLKRCLEA